LSETRAAENAGIHRLAIPTPFLVGRVNCYLIEDEPLTLIDTGPNSGKSLDELEQALDAHGHAVEDIELIVVTHQHMDHVGLLEILARRSGAEVAALEMLGPYLADFKGSATADDDFAQGVMRRHGIPAELATVLGAVGAAFRAFGSGGSVTQELQEGDRLTLRDRELLVLHRPGHSPSDTVFFDERRGILIGGDHLLAHISSNALVARDHPHPLLRYMDSMRATRELAAGLVLPGHAIR
jgi:glyoxylase-like metal-dependent hydrolase (beta-lactamase superfamily II)